METIVLLIRLALAGIFLAAGIAKLLDLPGSRRAMRDFGVPEHLANSVGMALVTAEILIGVLLIPAATAWSAGLLALVLLLAFIVGMANVMRQGQAPDCHCFGQMHSEPVGWRSLSRNVGFAVLALGVVVRGPSGSGPGPVEWWEQRSDAAQVALALGFVALTLLAAQGWFLYQLWQQNGRLLQRLDALEAIAETVQAEPEIPAGNGERATEFSLPDLDGVAHSLTSLRARGKPVVLIFTSPTCLPCVSLLPDIESWQQRYADRLTIVVVARGDVEANRAKYAQRVIAPVLVETESEVSSAYDARMTPSALVIHPDGSIAAKRVAGADSIRRLVAEQVSTPNPLLPDGRRQVAIGLSVGQAAPDLTLRNLEGVSVSLSEFRGDRVLLVFWNPQCGFCREMVAQLKAWERDRTESAPRLLIVSRGSMEDNIDQGFASPVLIDENLAASRAFGVGGTPAAVLVDANGKIASKVALGADAVWRLAGAPAAVAS